MLGRDRQYCGYHSLVFLSRGNSHIFYQSNLQYSEKNGYGRHIKKRYVFSSNTINQGYIES